MSPIRAFNIVGLILVAIWFISTLNAPSQNERLAQAKVLQEEGHKELLERRQLADCRAVAKSLMPGDIVRWDKRLWLVVNQGGNSGPMLHSFGSYRQIFLTDDKAMLALTEVTRWGSLSYTTVLQLMALEAVAKCNQVPSTANSK